MNIIRCFEIPVTGFKRAKEFYEYVLGITITERNTANAKRGFFGDPDTGVTGAIVKHEWYRPSEDGVLIYLDAGDDLAPALARAEAFGAIVLVPKTRIPNEDEFMAIFRDPEGNRIALLSSN